MSWLSISDFAKTALSDVQKKIDKVLDIQEEGPTPVLKEPELKEKEETQASLVTTPQSESQKSNKVTPSRKGLTHKKKSGKPAKLGSSLTKKHNKSLQNLSSALPKSEAPEPITQNLTPKPVTQPEEATDKGAKETSESTEEPSTENDVPVKDNDVDSSATPSPVSEQSNSNNENPSKSPSSESPSSEEGAPKQQQSNQRSDSDSPRASTSASSDIDILDHESEFSEISFVSKGQTELDASMMQFCAIDGNNLNVGGRMRAGNAADSNDSEASDIIAFSGYCSPVSVEGYDLHHQNLASPVNFAPTKPTSPSPPHVQDEGGPDQEDVSNLTITADTSLVSSCDSSTNKIVQPSPTTTTSATTMLTTTDSDVTISLSVDQANQDEIADKVESEKDKQIEEKENQLQVDENKDVKDEDVKPAMQSGIDKISQVENKQQKCEVNSEEESAKLRIYEQQLMTLSLNNARLNEDNDNLRSEVESLKLEIRPDIEKENTALRLTVEQLQSDLQKLKASKERDQSEISSLKADLSTRMSNEEVQTIIQEKEESIRGLLQEGEQLSKKEHQQSVLIKKLRSKLNESEKSSKDLNEKLTKLQKENENFNQKLTELETTSRNENERNNRVMEAYQEKEKDFNNVRGKLEDCEEKLRAAQSTLDAAYKEKMELNKKVATLESEKSKALEKCEEQSIKKLLLEKEEIEMAHNQQVELLQMQISEVRNEVERNDSQSAHREQNLHKEIADLRQRLQDSETRNFELTESISESTRPLIRQMENLQITHSNQAKTWEIVEKSLTARLDDAQLQLTTAQEREYNAQNLMKEAKKNVRKLEEQVNSVKHENCELTQEIKELKEKSSSLMEETNSLKRELAGKEELFDTSLSKLKRDKIQLENQIDNEKLKSENEKKKLQQHIEIITKEKERLLWINRQDSITSASMLNGDSESVASSTDHQTVDSSSEQLHSRHPSHHPSTSSLVYDNLLMRNNVSTSNLMENLQSQLKMREGEINQLQGEINILERTRSSMAEEIVRLTNENEEFESTKVDLVSTKDKLKEMQGRHDAVLMMYGEKAEENEELKMDLEDVKQMYRQQIDSLLSNPNR